MRAAELSNLERAAGLVFGEGREVRLVPSAICGREAGSAAAGGSAAPVAALVEACGRAVSRPPCVVSFSGGRDSSVALAVAVRAARERGLEPPIPVTLRFDGVRSTEESRWQELVISHLGLSEWVKVTVGDELDFLGERARTALARHGLLWPANCHFHTPIFERAAGGSVITGLDGDGLFGRWRWQRARAALAPSPRQLMRVLLAVSPRSVRTVALALRTPLYAGWLRPAARRRLALAVAAETAGEPRDWLQRVSWYARRRYLEVAAHSLALLAGENDVEVHHPLLDPEFLAALGSHGGRAGYGTRTDAMRTLFGGLLPDALLSRRGKAEFGAAFWGPCARQFVERWEGDGVDAALIDPERLRVAWRAENPPLGAATVLQQAWLAHGGAAHPKRCNSASAVSRGDES